MPWFSHHAQSDTLIHEHMELGCISDLGTLEHCIMIPSAQSSAPRPHIAKEHRQIVGEREREGGGAANGVGGEEKERIERCILIALLPLTLTITVSILLCTFGRACGERGKGINGFEPLL